MAESIDEDGSVVVQGAGLLDMNLWPHLHSADLRDKLFPVVCVAPDPYDEELELLRKHERLHRRWAALTPVQKTQVD